MMRWCAQAGGFFDRAAAANPFKDYSYVWVPYCTGDVHAGSNVVQYNGLTRQHAGYANLVDLLDDSGTVMPADVAAMSAGQVEPVWRAQWNIAAQIAPQANFKVFVKNAPGHVLLTDPGLTEGTTSVQQFVTRMVTDDPSWSSVTP